MKKEEQPIKLQKTDANKHADEIGKNMGYFHKSPKSHLMSYDAFVKASAAYAPEETKDEKKNKLK